MDERDWWSSRAPGDMLTFLLASGPAAGQQGPTGPVYQWPVRRWNGVVSGRKLRLLTCAAWAHIYARAGRVHEGVGPAVAAAGEEMAETGLTLPTAKAGGFKGEILREKFW